MRRPSRAPFHLALLVLLVLVVARGEAIGEKRRRRPRPTPVPTVSPLHGPPAPTPEALLRAAGACIRYEPGRFLIVAELDATGRVFRLDEATRVELSPSVGTRVRVLYVESPDGPLARRVLKGPVDPPKTPARVSPGPF